MLSYNHIGPGSKGDKRGSEGGAEVSYRSCPCPVQVDDDELLVREFPLNGCVEALPAV